MPELKTKKDGFQNKTDIYQLRYSNCWEDADVACSALAKVGDGGRLLSIASAGDNTLALLTLDPKEVVVVDVNPVQLAVLDLKARAIEQLSPWQLLEFLGVKEATNRAETYGRLRDSLRDETRVYFDKNLGLLAGGILHAGRLEGFYRSWRRLLRLAHGPGRIQQLLDGRSQLDQAEFYQRRWNTWRWRLVYKIAHGRRFLGGMGRDPMFYEHAPGDVVSGPLRGLGRVLTELPAFSNPYLVYQLTGNFSTQALPLYLRPETLTQIRDRVSRLVFRRGPVEEAAADGPYDGMNLSNIFEYMGQEYFEGIYRSLHQQLRRGGRMVYWNLHVDRRRPASLLDQVDVRQVEVNGLMRKEKTGVYSALRIEDRIDSLSTA